MILEKEETVEVDGNTYTRKVIEAPKYLDEQGTQALITALKDYADQELTGSVDVTINVPGEP